MSVAAKAPALSQRDPLLAPVERRGAANRRVARDFVLLLGGALVIGLVAGVGMMLAVLLIV